MVSGSVAFMEVGTSASESYWVPLASNSMGVENFITVARTASVLVYASYRACRAQPEQGAREQCTWN